MNVKARLIFYCLLFFGVNSLYAQKADNNSLSSPKIQNNLQLYLDSLQHYNLLFNGTEYTSTYPGTVGHPYFNEPFFKHGIIKYDGIVYPDVPLLYELTSGDILTKNSNNIRIILSPGKVQSFTIGKTSFLNLPNHESYGNTQQKYYRVIYDGNIKILVKSFKQLIQGLHGKDPYKFKQYDLYFILKDNNLIEIKNQATLINAFNKNKAEVNEIFKKNKMRFKKDPVETLTMVAKWYDESSK